MVEIALIFSISQSSRRSCPDFTDPFICAKGSAEAGAAIGLEVVVGLLFPLLCNLFLSGVIPAIFPPLLSLLCESLDVRGVETDVGIAGAE
jgi:hypothetical protein